MSKLPLVSVIVVNFNGKSFIGECIESVLASDYPNFEVVVIDNASTDGSYPYIKDRFALDRRLRLYRSDTQLFFAGGYNFGARNSLGEKLVLLNSDTVVTKKWLTELVNFAANHPNCLVQPKILSWQNKNRIDNVGGIYTYFGIGRGKGQGEVDSGQYDQDCQVDFANGTCFLIDRKLFDGLGGFDEWYKYHYEDVDLNFRAKKRGATAWYCWRSTIYHKGSLTVKSQLTSCDLQYNIRKNRVRTVVKNFIGIDRLVRLCTVVGSSLWLVVYYPSESTQTVRALAAVVNIEYKLAVDRLRLRELTRITKKPKIRLLDLGCGDGTFLNEAIVQGNEAVGVDVNMSTVCHCDESDLIERRSRRLEAGSRCGGTIWRRSPRSPSASSGSLAMTDTTKLVTSTIEDYVGNYQGKRFGVITLFHVLEHLANPSIVLSNIKKVLKPDGWCVIEVPLVGNLTEKFLGKSYLAYQDASHRSFFTKKSLFSLLDSCGLTVIKVGNTLLEFPFTVVTSAFRKNGLFGCIGLLVFLPLKILTLLGYNTEIIRVYCKVK